MPDAETRDRLQRIEDNVTAIKEDVIELRTEIQGPLLGVGRLPLRDRLHQLESDRASAKLAQEALEHAKTLRDDNKERRSARFQWLVSVCIACGALLLAVFK